MRVGLCPACGHVVAVSGGPRFYQVHEHTVDGKALAFVHRGDVACAGSGDYVPAHRTRYDEDTPNDDDARFALRTGRPT